MLLVRATLAIAIVATLAHPQTPPPTPTPTQTPSPTPSPAASPEPKHFDVDWRVTDLASATETDAAAWLVVGDAHLFVPGTGDTVEARSITDGRIAWSWNDRCVIAPAVTGANLAIVTKDSLIVVDQASGQARWRVPIEATGAPALVIGLADRIAIVFEGGIQTWDASGKAGWRATFTGMPVTNAATAGNLLVFGTDEPALVGMDAASGVLKWKIPLPTKPKPLAATADRIYFGGDDGRLYSYGTDGKPKWKWRQSHRPMAIGAPLVDNRIVYFTLLDNSIRGFAAGGGTEQSDQVLESRPLAGPMRLSDTLGIALTNGRVAEVGIKNGKLVGPASGAPGPAVRFLAAAAAIDKSRIYTVTIAIDFSRTLIAWSHATATEGKNN